MSTESWQYESGRRIADTIRHSYFAHFDQLVHTTMEVRDEVKMRIMGKRQRRQVTTMLGGAGLVLIITTVTYLLVSGTDSQDSPYDRSESVSSARGLSESITLHEQKFNLLGGQVILDFQYTDNVDYFRSRRGEQEETLPVASKQQTLDSPYSAADAYPVIPQSSHSGFFYPTRWLWRHFSSVDTTGTSTTRQTGHDYPRDSRKSSSFLRRSKTTDDDNEQEEKEGKLSALSLPSIDIVKRKSNNNNVKLATADTMSVVDA